MAACAGDVPVLSCEGTLDRVEGGDLLEEVETGLPVVGVREISK
jgi:hypothetical protein